LHAARPTTAARAFQSGSQRGRHKRQDDEGRRVRMISAPGFGGAIFTGRVSLPRSGEATPPSTNDKVRA